MDKTSTKKEHTLSSTCELRIAIAKVAASLNLVSSRRLPRSFINVSTFIEESFCGNGFT